MFALLPPVPHLVKAYPVIQPFHFADTYLLAVIELVGKIVFFLTRHRCFFVSIYKGAGNDVPDVSDIHPFNLLPGDMSTIVFDMFQQADAGVYPVVESEVPLFVRYQGMREVSPHAA